MKKNETHAIVAEIKRLKVMLGRTPSKAEFEMHAEISMRQVRNAFGSYITALQAAGEKPHPHTNKRIFDKFGKTIERQTFQHEDKLRLMKKFDAEVLPYAERWAKSKGGDLTIMVMSDLHSQWVDPFCLAVAEDIAKRIQPDIINFDGDVADFYEISRFSKDPERRLKMQDEIDFVSNEMFARFRKAAPNAQIDFVLGNHELRLLKYLCDFPGLSSLRALQFDKLFELEKHKINLIARKNFLTQSVKKSQNYVIYGNAFVVYHGFSLGTNHAMANLQRWGKSGVSGHVHKYQVHTKRDLHGNKFWISMGTMASYELAEEYVDEIDNWTKGFLVVHIRDGQVVPEYVDCSNEFAVFGGKIYTRKK